MRTQRAQRPRRARRLIAAPALSMMAWFVLVTGASAQTGAGSGGDGGPPAALLLAAAALLLLAAATIGYRVPARRRRRESHTAGAAGQAQAEQSLGQAAWELHERAPAGETAAGSREAALPQSERRVPETGHAPTGLPHTGRERALGYTTFPERRRAVSPESRYQARRIAAACEARGMVLHKLVGDVQSYSGPDLERPGLTHALELLSGDEASCLVVAGLDRLSRSAANLGTVIEWLDEIGARLVVMDIDLDTDTEEGRLAARALVRVGALERRSGTAPLERPAPRERPGSTRGRPAVADLPLLQRRIATMRASGMTLQAIADTLNREGVPTLRGGAKWRPSSVQAATGYKRPGRQPTEPAGAEREDDG